MIHFFFENGRGCIENFSQYILSSIKHTENKIYRTCHWQLLSNTWRFKNGMYLLIQPRADLFRLSSAQFHLPVHILHRKLFLYTLLSVSATRYRSHDRSMQDRLVAELSNITQYQESMCESFRNIELFLIFFCQLHTEPFSVCLAVTS